MFRYCIMATQLLATLITVHHLLKREIVVYLVNLRHLFHSIPLDVCYVSRLERCFNDSPRELILRCSILEKIDPSRVFLFLSLSCWLEYSEQDDETKMVIESTPLCRCNLDREDYISLRSPFILPYAGISGRDNYLVGVSCHIPSSDLLWAS